MQVGAVQLESVQTENGLRRIVDAQQRGLHERAVHDENDIRLLGRHDILKSPQHNRRVKGEAVKGDFDEIERQLHIDFAARVVVLKVGAEQGDIRAALFQAGYDVIGVHPAAAHGGPVECQVDKQNARFAGPSHDRSFVYASNKISAERCQ